ncbi:MAG: linear amide C-N hydrolase, partial [Pirellulaceae bacterium]
MTRYRLAYLVFVLGMGCLLLLGERARACTGITLRAKDGAVVFGRTLEWGAFDLNSRLVVIPRGLEFQSRLQDG